MKDLNAIKKAIILIGLPGSGKTTFYNEYFYDAVHINLDELHTRNKEMIAIRECLDSGKDLVIDNTNPTKVDRERYIPLAKENSYRIIGYYFSAKISDCIRRNSQREGKARVPDKAILAIYNKLEIPSYEEGFDELYYVMTGDNDFRIEEWKEDEI